MRDLAVLIPTRGRPENIRKVIGAWDFTNAWDRADMVLIIDKDDPEYPRYLDVVEETRHPDTGDVLVKTYEVDWHMAMVHKLNQAAVALFRGWFALGFAGDDHLPQTIGWADRYVSVLRELGTGMVYGDDGYQGRKLSTEWAITSDVVGVLGRMVPADVEHMYCDNSMMDLFRAAGALRWLPEIRIEHMHPVAGKAASDAQYQRVNHRDQFSKDRRGYEGWKHGDVFRTDVAEVRHLRRGRPDVTEPTTPAERPKVAGSAPRRVQRSGPTARRLAESPARTPRPPRHFRNVQGATPEDEMVTLADLAMSVPADQEIVELGVFQGRTALQLAWGASLGNGAHVTAVDAWDLEGNTYGPPFTDPATREAAAYNVQALGFADKIRLVHNFASDEAARYDGPPVGLLFVDDDHDYAGARRAVEDWAPHLAPGATIAVDDYGHPDWPGVQMAVDDLVSEGVLEPIEIHGERLAVTRLSTGERKTPAAVTSEGVSPSPYPAVAGQVADGPEAAPEKREAEIEVAAEPDTEVSEDWGWKVTPGEAIAVNVPLGPVADLNTVQLRALAKHRGITLGIRKDKRDLILQALKDGR
jgi:predicted O-methyltransferase YrrM